MSKWSVPHNQNCSIQYCIVLVMYGNSWLFECMWVQSCLNSGWPGGLPVISNLILIRFSNTYSLIIHCISNFIWMLVYIECTSILCCHVIVNLVFNFAGGDQWWWEKQWDFEDDDVVIVMNPMIVTAFEGSSVQLANWHLYKDTIRLLRPLFSISFSLRIGYTHGPS